MNIATNIGLIAAMVLLAWNVPASGSSLEITGASNFQILQRLTGTPSQNNTVASMNIGGTDIGTTVNHDGRTYFLFGDTFSGEEPHDGGSWRRNVMAWTADTDPSDGIVFDDWLKNPTTGYAKVAFSNNEPVGSRVVTNIPTGGISINGSLYVWFMNVNQWGPDGGEWYISQAELAKWGGGNTEFAISNTCVFPGDTNFGMVAAREGWTGNPADPYVYLWGTPAGRFGGVKLARFLPSNIENRSAYEYYDGMVGGTPRWISNEYDADVIVPASVGEMSVMYNDALDAWTILYFNEFNDRFEIRQSDTPWGAWSDPVTVMMKSQCPSGTRGPYAPMMNPLWVEDGGRTIYFTMSLWEPYDVYLAKVTLDIVPEPATLTTFTVGLTAVSALGRRRRA